MTVYKSNEIGAFFVHDKVVCPNCIEDHEKDGGGITRDDLRDDRKGHVCHRCSEKLEHCLAPQGEDDHQS